MFRSNVPASDLPEGWRPAQLSDIATVHGGGRLKLNKSHYTDTGARAYSAAGPDGFVVQVEGTAPSIVLSSIGARCGKAFLTDGPWTTLANTQVITPEPAVASATFLHAILDDETYWNRSGSAQPFIKPSDVKGAWVPLPPLDEQRRIAEVLRSIDDAIQAASDVAAASFDTLTRVRDELICLSAYETVPLVELTDEGLFTDGDWVESKDQDPNGEVRLIQLADIGDGNFIDKSRRFLTMGKARQLRCTFLQEGDLLVARMPDPLGRCCLLPPQSQPCVTVVDVCVIRAGPRTSNRYLAHAIGTSEFRTAIVACASGTTRTRVSRGNLGQLRVPLPSPGIQQDIIDALDQMALVSEQEQQAVEKMLILKHEIMSDLLSGRVRVPA